MARSVSILFVSPISAFNVSASAILSKVVDATDVVQVDSTSILNVAIATFCVIPPLIRSSVLIT